MKKNHKKIFLLLIILMAVLASTAIFSSVEAAITVDGGKVATDKDGGEFWSQFSGVLGDIFKLGFNGIGSAIGILIVLLAGFLLLILYAIFSVSTGDLGSPFPDALAFNKTPLFDANFINPHNNSLIAKMGQDIFANLFETFYVIALAVFIISAMVTGLKLALSTVAAKKAQYKEAVLKWVTGFLILLCLRWLMAGIFYVNEFLVTTIANESAPIDIPYSIVSAIPLVGATLDDVLNQFGVETNVDGFLPGYFGIAFSNALRGFGGNLVAAIVAFVILGQTFTFIGAYLKRLFMCLLLGLVSPLIVAADTIVSATGGQSQIFKNWLKNFSLTVFMQSFHAMFMLVILMIISKLYNDSSLGSIIQAVVVIVLTTGLVKMEKLIKNMFGIGDSLAGDLKEGSKGFVAALGAAKGAGMAIKSVADNAPKMKDAAKRKQAYKKELDILKAPEKSSEAYKAAKDAKAAGNMDEYHKQMAIAAEQRRLAKLGAVNASSSNSSEKDGKKEKGDYLQQVLNKNNQPTTREQRIQKLEEGYAQASADYKSARLAGIMGAANLAAGIGMGLGMGDDVGEALFKGGVITATLDRGAEIVGGRMADKDRRRFAKNEATDGERYGYTPSDKIERQKGMMEKAIFSINPKERLEYHVDIAKGLKEVLTNQEKRPNTTTNNYTTNSTTTNNNHTTNNTTTNNTNSSNTTTSPNVTVDVTKISKEINKEFRKFGEAVGDDLKNDLRSIDRDIDNN